MERVRLEAYKKFNQALNRGEIVRSKFCQLCGRDVATTIGHHADYSRPLEVCWLCPICHQFNHFNNPNLIRKDKPSRQNQPAQTQLSQPEASATVSQD